MPKTIDYTELFDTYAQSQAQDMDVDDLVQFMKESIEARLADLPLTDALEEIRDNSPALLEGYEEDE